MEKRRWFFVVNALGGFLLLGLIYAWSVFVRPLELEFGWTRSQTSMTFSICMAVFCLGGLAAGWLLKKISPRTAILLSAGFIMTGFFLTSRAQSLHELYIFYGALCGFGIGVGYNTLLDASLRWFPDRQGLVSGILLMGFGMGGSLLGTVAFAMINAMGWRDTFAALGIMLALLLAVISMNVKRPAPGQAPHRIRESAGQELQAHEMLRDGSFYAYYFRSMFVTATGLTIVGNAAPFVYSIAKDPATAVNIAGLASIFSGVGRVAGGVVFDKLGSRRTLWIGVAGLAAAAGVLTCAALNGSLALLTAGYVLGGFFYGSNIPCNSGFIHKIYGQENFAVNLGVMNTNLLFASFLGPYVSGVLFARTGSYAVPCAVLLVMCGGAAAATALLRKHYSSASAA